MKLLRIFLLFCFGVFAATPQKPQNKSVFWGLQTPIPRFAKRQIA
jgi:hypothetical protein